MPEAAAAVAPAPTDPTLAPAPAAPSAAIPAPGSTPVPAAAAPAAPAPPPALAAGGTGAATTQVTTPADWPADWREKAAGEDKAFLGVLKRYTDPVAALNWTRTQQLKLSAGELRPTLKADASPEEIAEYRKSHGVPEKADGYVDKLKVGDGIVIGEADKPLLKSFAETALAKNIPQESFDHMVNWFFEQQTKATADRAGADQDQRIAGEQALIQSMGNDFKPNMNALSAFWKGQPEGIADTVLGARTADGKLIGNLPEVTSWIAGIARELNPAATLLPAGTASTPQNIATRMREIEGMMYVDGKPNPAYWGTAVEKEYRDLITAEQQMKARAA